MRFAFDEDQLALRDGVRAFLTSECTPDQIRAAWDTPTGRSPQRWEALAAMGVVGVTVPEEFGGMGLDETWLVLLLEEAGRAALPEALGSVVVAAALLADAGSDDQRETWLPRIAAGDAVVVASLPSAPWVDDAHVADLILLTDGSEVHAVAPAAVELVAQPQLDRSRRPFSVSATLNARSCMAVRAGGAVALAADRARLAEGAVLLGTASKLIDLARDYALEREQFGVAIGSFQAVKHQLASALVKTEFARPAVYRAAWSVATDATGRAEHVKMAHVLAAQAAHTAARTALQVHGAIGYTEEHDLHLWLRRGLMAPASAGAAGLPI